VTGLTVGEALTVAGTSLSAMSVLIVYHMFVLQDWLDKVEVERGGVSCSV
jgi:hypothetical protein